MIDHLNYLIRHLMLSEVAQLSDELQVGFQAPDDAWRTFVSTLTAEGLPANALNVYLLELRENITLRSNAMTRRVDAGVVIELPAPRRLDCHYLITAWSPAAATPAVEPIADEHELLYQAIEVLMRHDPLVPSAVYAPDPVPFGTPEAFATATLPIKLLPPDGFPRHAEFWGTMGAEHRWKPSVELIVTLPVVQTERTAGAQVTSRIIEYRITGTLTSEISVQIGGHVLNVVAPLPDGSPAPIAQAWVGLEDARGQLLQTTATNDVGEFTFVGLRRDVYTLRARATGLGDVAGSFAVPSPSGTYDLLFQ
jgi:Pvc16 N-terminal domain